MARAEPPVEPGAEPVVGILMLDARFPRPPGDVGNPETWPFPVRYATVEGARVERVVRAGGPSPALLEPFVEAGLALVAQGAAGLTTSCGFLVRFQRELAARLPVPVATSSLLQVPWVQATLPAGRRVGVVTFDARELSADHLRAAGAPADTPVAGVENGRELARVIRGDLAALDVASAEADVLAAGEALLAAAPEVGAVVLECANMAPYSRAVSLRFGLPVYDIVSLVTWFYGGLRPVAWPARTGTEAALPEPVAPV